MALFKAFTAQNTHSNNIVRRGDVGVVIQGTWTGSILVEEWVPGIGWVIRATYTSNQDVKLNGGQDETLWRMSTANSAWTGTANATLR